MTTPSAGSVRSEDDTPAATQTIYCNDGFRSARLDGDAPATLFTGGDEPLRVPWISIHAAVRAAAGGGAVAAGAPAGGPVQADPDPAPRDAEAAGVHGPLQLRLVDTDSQRRCVLLMRHLARIMLQDAIFTRADHRPRALFESHVALT